MTTRQEWGHDLRDRVKIDRAYLCKNDEYGRLQAAQRETEARTLALLRRVGKAIRFTFGFAGGFGLVQFVWVFVL